MAELPPPAWAVRTEADHRALAAGYWWDEAAAERVTRFAERHLRPKFTTGPFVLLEWQRRTLARWYGWRAADGSRRWRRALLHVPKKNGKTLLVSVVAAYELLGQVAAAPLVVAASTTKTNAKQVYDQLSTCCRRNPALKKVTRRTPSKRLIEDTRDDGGQFESLSSDAPAAEGLNCSVAIVDEAHAHQSADLYRALEFSMIGRPDGFAVVISTAGKDMTHWYYGLVERGRAVAAGDDLDPTFSADVYEADPERQDLNDPATWKSCNPSLDLYDGFTSEKFGKDWNAAKVRTTDRLSFERYRFNVFRRSADNTWVDVARWDACRGALPPAEELKGLPCYLGFDASQRLDPTSIAAVWVRPDRRFYVRSWAFVCEAGLKERERTNLPRYQQFAADGHMVVTAGDVIDVRAVLKKFDELIAGNTVRALVMDPNGAWVVSQLLDGVLGGDRIFRQPQTHRWFHGPTRELETCVTERRLIHDGNSWLRWCINCVRLDTDRYNNVRPLKSKATDHIDGAIALLMSFALADKTAATPPAKPSVYETRGFRSL